LETEENALHVATVPEQEQIAEGGREAEASTLQHEAEREAERPEPRELGIDPVREDEDERGERPSCDRPERVA
jgi:hypothetical protein